jgi:hypothetical protein
MPHLYILRDKQPVPVDDVVEWGKFFETAARQVARDEIGDVTVSTVFLGLDHRFMDDGPPVLFETMIFGGVHNEYQERYCTWDEAEAGHAQAVALVRAAYE